MEKLLHTFYNDEYLRDAVHEFLLLELDKYALEKVYDKEDTGGIADAKDAIERAFTELRERYSKEGNIEVVNQSR